ncbi:taste receptor type 2 member 8-like [Sceloporus undulatus]|uniref:taste receptor type 2 member 8-like n=1 Tax=Sceloporus undulatus TaxID=8520 RepID=UPI001C4B1DD7|nr:taste receptor type 2 member 8-like [Sceloporus undulatus]
MISSKSPVDILITIITETVRIASLLGNGFITVVEGHQWLRNRKMLSCDVLLISLTTSRFVMELHSSVSGLLYLISSETWSSKQAYLYIVWIFFNMLSLWSATWLSVFYCVKVTNFANRVFHWLKQRINMLAPRLLGWSMVISSIFFLLPLVEYFGHKKWDNLTLTPPGWANPRGDLHKPLYIFLPLQLTYTSINFTISITASIILLASLWKHTRNLKKSGVGDKDLSTQVHINVIMLLLCYVFFYFLYFSSMILFVSKVVKYGTTAKQVLDLLAATFPCAHAIILILTNPKLKEMAAHILNIRQRAS